MRSNVSDGVLRDLPSYSRCGHFLRSTGSSAAAAAFAERTGSDPAALAPQDTEHAAADDLKAKRHGLLMSEREYIPAGHTATCTPRARAPRSESRERYLAHMGLSTGVAPEQLPVPSVPRRQLKAVEPHFLTKAEHRLEEWRAWKERNGKELVAALRGTSPRGALRQGGDASATSSEATTLRGAPRRVDDTHPPAAPCDAPRQGDRVSAIALPPASEECLAAALDWLQQTDVGVRPSLAKPAKSEGIFPAERGPPERSPGWWRDIPPAELNTSRSLSAAVKRMAEYSPRKGLDAVPLSEMIAQVSFREGPPGRSPCRAGRPAPPRWKHY